MLEQRDAYKMAMEEQAIVCWVPIEGKTPQKLLQDIIEWNCGAALDPRISNAAMKLQKDVLLKAASELVEMAGRIGE